MTVLVLFYARGTGKSLIGAAVVAQTMYNATGARMGFLMTPERVLNALGKI